MCGSERLAVLAQQRDAEQKGERRNINVIRVAHVGVGEMRGWA
jgi:hypothetical protein